jgi:hypothetical protein
VATKKRKIFDAGKQRATDSDVPYKATRKTAQVSVYFERLSQFFFRLSIVVLTR